MSVGRYDPRRVAVLISGFGSNLQALLDAADGGGWPGHVCLVVSDQAQAYGLERARQAGVATLTLAAADFPDRPAYDAALGDALQAHDVGLIVLAGFMRILGTACVERFAGRMLNVHPSLLPRFRGLHTHQRVLEAGDAHHGATVHFVTAELDGGPRVIQYRIPVRADDTPESLSARVQAGEHIILPRAAGWFAAGRLSMNQDTPQLDGQPLTEPLLVEGEEQP
jgi:phosphoribosylglycinamide formyltransferase-1